MLLKDLCLDKVYAVLYTFLKPFLSLNEYHCIPTESPLDSVTHIPIILNTDSLFTAAIFYEMMPWIRSER